jgi:hypothetical protein
MNALSLISAGSCLYVITLVQQLIMKERLFYMYDPQTCFLACILKNEQLTLHNIIENLNSTTVFLSYKHDDDDDDAIRI